MALGPQGGARPAIGVGTGFGLLRLAGEVLQCRGCAPRPAHLTPLAHSLDWIDWDALHANVAGGLMHAVARGHVGERGVPRRVRRERVGSPPRSDREIEYVHTRLEGQHVRASAAIPLLFPPVEVTAPLGAAGHYVDGATRLNAPIAPALALGAERVIVVGYEPFAGERGRGASAGARAAAPRATSPPTRSTACCSTRSPTTCAGCSPSTRSSPSTRPRAPRAPPAPTARPTAARRTGASPTRSSRRRGAAKSARWPRRLPASATAACAALRSPDFALLSRLLGGGAAAARGELLSFIFFDEVFIERLLEFGRADAQRWLDEHPGFWSADATAAGFDAPEVSSEAVALDEFRARRR